MTDDEIDASQERERRLSRRQWLLKLGEAAVLLGFSETRGEGQAAGTSPAAPAAAHNLAELPPGLYEPSNDHLSHALSSDSLFHPAPPDTETGYARPRTGPYQPRFFSPSEFQTVKRIVELMLGEAEAGDVAAGAADDHENIVAVAAEWIDLRVASAPSVRDAAKRLAPDHRALAVAYYGATAPVEELEHLDPERISREGLAWLNEESGLRHGKPFRDLADDQQAGILREIADDRAGATGESAGRRLFKWMKAEIIRGFYTSRTGLKELDDKRNAFYAESPGCGHDH
jgi:hypothetical protein